MTDQINYSLALENNFQIFVEKLPNVQFFMQDSPLPELSCGPTEYDIQNGRLRLQDNVLDWGALNIGFQIDEYWYAYEEIWNWMINMSNPVTPEDNDGLRFSDVHLKILDNNKNSFMYVKFVDCHPTSLGGPVFTTSGDSNFLSGDCNMAYNYAQLIRTRTDTTAPMRVIPEAAELRLRR